MGMAPKRNNTPKEDPAYDEAREIASRTRDETGLLPIQRAYLEAFVETGSKSAALKKLNLAQRQVTRWLREDPAFLQVHNEYFSQSHQATAARFQSLQEKLPELAEDLMEATKTLKVIHQCTHCGERDDVFVDTNNDTVRARILEMLMKAMGHLKDVRRIEGEINITELTAGERIALERIKRGLDVSVPLRKTLESRGLLEGVQHYDGSDVLEGEAREVPS
jgi:hypothetical protein